MAPSKPKGAPPAKKVQKKSIKCRHPGCKGTFARKKHMDEHKRVVHDKKFLKCSEEGCIERYNYEVDLKRHCRQQHTSEEDREVHRCHICDRKYTRKANLTKHIGKHPPEPLEQIQVTTSVSDQDSDTNGSPRADQEASVELRYSTGATSTPDPASASIDFPPRKSVRKGNTHIPSYGSSEPNIDLQCVAELRRKLKNARQEISDLKRQSRRMERKVEDLEGRGPEIQSTLSQVSMPTETGAGDSNESWANPFRGTGSEDFVHSAPVSLAPNDEDDPYLFGSDRGFQIGQANWDTYSSISHWHGQDQQIEPNPGAIMLRPQGDEALLLRPTRLQQTVKEISPNLPDAAKLHPSLVISDLILPESHFWQ